MLEALIKAGALDSFGAPRRGLMMVLEQALQAADQQAKDPGAARRRMFDAFSDIGVKPSEIETWLGHSADQINKTEGDQLKSILGAIKEGELTWHEVMSDREGKPNPAKPTNGGKPADPPTPSDAAQPTTTEPTTPAQPTKPAAPAPARASTGKGTAALKVAVAKVEAQPPAASDKPDVRPSLNVPPGTPPPEQGNEYRACAKCGLVVEVPLTDPPGGMCYACSAAARE